MPRRISLLTLAAFLMLCSSAFWLLWTWAPSRPLIKLNDEHGPVQAACFSPDGSLVACADANFNELRLMEPNSGHNIRVISIVTEPVGILRLCKRGVAHLLAFSPDGQYIAAGYQADTHWCVAVWRVADGSSVINKHVIYDDSQVPMKNVAFSRDGAKVCVLCEETVVLSYGESKSRKNFSWDVSKGGSPSVGDEQVAAPYKGTSSPDGTMSIRLGQNGEARIWKTVRPESWWGVFWLPAFWAALLLAGLFIWSIWRDQKRFRSGTGKQPGV